MTRKVTVIKKAPKTKTRPKKRTVRIKPKTKVSPSRMKRIRKNGHGIC